MFNTSSESVDISGYKLRGCAATSGALSDRATVPGGTVLAPGQHYLFTNNGSAGYSGTVPGDQTYGAGFTDLTATNQSGARLEAATTTLGNLWDRAPEQERYSFAFQGRLQTLDHVLVTRGLQKDVGDFRYAHSDNDYFERDDPADGPHVSDHDPPVLTLSRGKGK